MVDLQHVSTHDPGIVAWGKTRLTVVPSTGQVVIWGKPTHDDSPLLHIYNGSSASWEKERIQSQLCENEKNIFIYPLLVENEQLLGVSCWNCKKIRLYNLKTREITTGFHDQYYYPGYMCQGGRASVCCPQCERSQANLADELLSASVHPHQNHQVRGGKLFCNLPHPFPGFDCHQSDIPRFSKSCILRYR